MLTPAKLQQLRALAIKAKAIAPGDWYEEGEITRDSGTEYRESTVQFTLPGRTISGVVVTTMNGYFGFDPEERQTIGEFIAELANHAIELIAIAETRV